MSKLAHAEQQHDPYEGTIEIFTPWGVKQTCI
jgi:hypothetical protein